MNRHLLPDEIDLLLDGEVGFGITQLKSHLRGCDRCRAELEEARILVRALESLPHLEPAPLFAHRVMARVQVYVPWHVAARDWVRGQIPASPAGRALAGVTAGGLGVALTLVGVLVLTQLDATLFALDLALTRLREGLFGGVSAVLGVAFGEPALVAIQAAGPAALLGASLLLLLLTAGAARLLRSVAVPRRTAAARQR